ncbi:hypothetical protein IWX50DRAFT_616354 [Phyllosticta citricarpa]|uniref:Uncharacterized protein n=1 Tax=Phyllosticta citricarpa TaxID=55181 RepID=A0ABR1M972_9PEZI
MAPRKTQPISPPTGFSPPKTRLRSRRTAQDSSSQEAESQPPMPAAPATRKRATTTKPKAEPKSKVASKTTSKAASKSSGRVTKPRGKAATKNKKTAVVEDDHDDADEPAEDHDDAPADTPVKLAPKTPAKTPAKTPGTKKATKNFNPEQLMVRRTRRSVATGWKSPLSQEAQNIMGIVPHRQAEQESTPLSIVKDDHEEEKKEEEEWFPPAPATPYKSAQKSATKSEHEISSAVFPASSPFQTPAITTFVGVSSPFCPPTVSQIAGLSPETPAPAPAPATEEMELEPSSVVVALAGGEQYLPSSPPPPAFPSPAPQAVAECAVTPRADSPMEDQPSLLHAEPQSGTPYSPSYCCSPAAPLPSSPPCFSSSSSSSSDEEMEPKIVPLDDGEVMQVARELEGLRERGASTDAMVRHAYRLGVNTLASVVVALTIYRANVEDAAGATVAAIAAHAAALAAPAAAESQPVAAAADDAEDEEVLQEHDDEATTGGSEADDGQDVETEEEVVVEEEEADAGVAGPETPDQEPAQTTPSSSYYLGGLFSKGISTGKHLLNYINPWASKPQSPQSPSPTPIRSLNRKGPISPRIKNADKRARMAAEQRAKIEEARREQEARHAEVQKVAEQAAAQVAGHQPGQKRKRVIGYRIPAHRPGERGYGMIPEVWALEDDQLIDEYPRYADDDDGKTPSPEPTPATKRAKVDGNEAPSPEPTPANKRTNVDGHEAPTPELTPATKRANVDDDDAPSPDLTPATKRTKFWNGLEQEEDPRLKEPITLTNGHNSAAEKTAEFEGHEETLQRPRNALRRAIRKETGKDLADKHHETKIRHHENSFSRSPLRDNQSVVNRRPSNEAQPAPSTSYTGSIFAVPGDSGYSSNVFKSSDMQAEAEKREEFTRSQMNAFYKSKMPLDTMKDHAARLWKIPDDELTPEEKEFLDRAERVTGHIRGTGSFTCPEGESDTESESGTTEATETDDDELVASSGVKQASDLTPSTTTAPTSTASAPEVTTSSPATTTSAPAVTASAPAATTSASSVKQPKSILKKPAEKPAEGIVPPPTPKPANAQLPTTTEGTQAAPKPASVEVPTEGTQAVSKSANAQLPTTTEGTQAAPKPASLESPTEEQPAPTSDKPANPLIHDAYLDRPRAGADAKESIARARRNAEKHRPTKPSNLSYVQRVASSPIHPTGEAVTNPMSESLITQGMGSPAVNNQAAATLTPFGNNSNSAQDLLPWETPSKAKSTEPAVSSLAGNDTEAVNAFKAALDSDVAKTNQNYTPGHKRKRSTEEVFDGGWGSVKKAKTATMESIPEQVPNALCDFLISHKNRLTASISSDLSFPISSKRQALWDSRFTAFLEACGQAST